jgi:hypothetical protein
MADIFYYQLDRPERAMAGLYPLMMLTYGCIVAAPLYLMVIAINAVILFRAEAYYELGHLLGLELVTVAAALFGYFVYGNAITKLGRVSCTVFTILFGLLMLWQIPDGIARILRHSETASPVLSGLAFAVILWVTGSIAFNLFRLARATDQDRYLLRAPFNGMTSRMAIQLFCGLPPIINFVKGIKARLLILASTLFFALAFGMLTGPMREVGNADEQADQIVILAMVLIVVPLSIAIANWLLNRAHKRIRFSVEGITAADPRAPVLFLRAFRDDQVTLARPRHTPLGRLFAIAVPRQSLDHMLLNEGTLYGPMVALGNPKDEMPPYGVARGYVANERWQDAVTQMARASLAVVICVDDTDSMWWEIEHLVGHDHLKKTLFLIHPNFRTATENQRIIGRLLPKLPISGPLQHSVRETFQTADVVGFFFDQDGNLCVGKSRFFTFFTYLLMTRWFFRHKFGLYLTRANAGSPPVPERTGAVAASTITSRGR